MRANKRRPTKTGATSIFSGLLCCADCGAKLSLNVSNGYKYFRCGGYKRNSRMNACSIHYIRKSVLKQLQQFLSYLQHFERVFDKQQIDSQMADYIFRKTYEDNATGKLSDKQFYRLYKGDEAEQEKIRTEIAKHTEEIGQTDIVVHNVEKLIAVTRKYTSVEQLTPEILNALITKIVVHEAVKTDGMRTQTIDIYYSYVGIIYIPTDEELKHYAGKHGRKSRLITGKTAGNSSPAALHNILSLSGFTHRQSGE